MEQPKHRNDLLGKYRLLNGNVLTTNVSFDSKEDAEKWSIWNNFGNENHPYTTIENPQKTLTN